MFVRKYGYTTKRYLDRKYIGVEVRKTVNNGKNYLVVQAGGIALLKEGTEIVPIDNLKDVVVVDENMKEIAPSWRYYVTTETIDPYHYVIDKGD